ncbi:hypothetical protein DV735_g805, partial [Chaetothyriales sp. CBS 134920]
MPRPRKAELEGKEVKKRSRNGCWPCKSRKVKCGPNANANAAATTHNAHTAHVNAMHSTPSPNATIIHNFNITNANIITATPNNPEAGANASPSANIMHNFPRGSIILSPPEPPTSIPIASPAPPPLNSRVEMPALNTSIVSNSIASSTIASTTTIAATTPNPANTPNSANTTPPATALLPHPQHEPPLPAISPFPGSFGPAASEFNPTMLTSAGFRTPSWNEPSSMRHRDSIAGPMIGPRGSISMPAYPSPSDSIYGGPPSIPGGLHDLSVMPPPLPASNSVHFQDSMPSPCNSAKRRRLSPQYPDGPSSNPSLFYRFVAGGADNANLVGEGARVHFPPATPTSYPLCAPNPLTPAPSTQTDDDRRISVSSLLSEDPEPVSKRSSRSDGGPTSHPTSLEGPSRRGSLHQRMISYSETEMYGHDRGAPDFDIPHNDDANAISEHPPPEQADFSSWLEAKFDDPSFGFGTVSRQQVFAAGGYYASPVPIKIPRKLEPLPPSLTENPMNLLYFHHFLNHTAKILVPHDCPENPFKTILAKMAVENPNLLNLMLAYSASHRARLLSHPEPANRIAVWVRDVFPALRQTLDDVSNTEVSNANLATAIMLASLEIISPSSFGVSIPWQDHLSVARSIIRSRGGPNSVSRQDPVMFFLTRWMAYLDVMGSLSGSRSDEPLFAGNYWSSSGDLSSTTSSRDLSIDDESLEDEDDYTIDCLLGFTTKCVSILAQVALLARECEPHRIDPRTHKIRVNWRPGPDIEARADKLRRDLEHAMSHEQKNCIHHSLRDTKAKAAAPGPTSAPSPAAAPATTQVQAQGPTSSPSSSQPTITYASALYQEYPERRYSAVQMSAQDAHESLSTNSAFHYAGLVHLLRRVHNLPRSDPAIQSAVHSIISVLSSVRVGGSAEACCLFPTITAGLEAESELDRMEVVRRLKKAEQLGMCQVGRARRLMEESWRRGESWEEMRGVEGAFFG